MPRSEQDIIKSMTNLGDSGQEVFVGDYTELAKIMLYEMGVSQTYIDSNKSAYVIGKIVTDLVEDGTISTTTEELIKSLRTNHPHSEDADV